MKCSLCGNIIADGEEHKSLNTEHHEYPYLHLDCFSSLKEVVRSFNHHRSIPFDNH